MTIEVITAAVDITTALNASRLIQRCCSPSNIIMPLPNIFAEKLHSRILLMKNDTFTQPPNDNLSLFNEFPAVNLWDGTSVEESAEYVHPYCSIWKVKRGVKYSLYLLQSVRIYVRLKVQWFETQFLLSHHLNSIFTPSILAMHCLRARLQVINNCLLSLRLRCALFRILYFCSCMDCRHSWFAFFIWLQ